MNTDKIKESHAEAAEGAEGAETTRCNVSRPYAPRGDEMSSTLRVVGKRDAERPGRAFPRGA